MHSPVQLKDNQEDNFESFLRESPLFDKKQVVRDIRRLPGDASTRQYYRLTGLHGTKPFSYIIMKMDPFEQSSSLPFIEVQNHLHHRGIPVPAIYHVAPRDGLLLLEDLGDDTFLKRLESVDTEVEEIDLYKQIIDLLFNMHERATDPADIAAFRNQFDVDKFMWEINYAIENFYLNFLKRKVPAGDIRIIRDTFKDICTILAAEPMVFTHRDFHSRNIMVHDNRNYFIDFQDARLGLRQYDLASLLRDSYYQLRDDVVDLLVDYYLDKMVKSAHAPVDRAHFKYMFDLAGLQRNFKAIGSFASFYAIRGNPQYLKYIGNTFENLRKVMRRYPEYKQLRSTLFRHYYF